MNCKKRGCGKPISAADIKRGMVYCDIKCAPLGGYGSQYKPRKKKKKEVPDENSAMA